MSIMHCPLADERKQTVAVPQGARLLVVTYEGSHVAVLPLASIWLWIEGNPTQPLDTRWIVRRDWPEADPGVGYEFIGMIAREDGRHHLFYEDRLTHEAAKVGVAA